MILLVNTYVTYYTDKLQIANMLFIESPAGVGFSFSEDGNYNTNDDQVGVKYLKSKMIGHFTMQSILLHSTLFKVRLRG